MGLFTCSFSCSNGYVKFTVMHSLASFLFEYPSTYSRPYVDRSSDSVYSVSTTRNYENLETRSTISFIVSKSHYFTPDSKTQLEKNLESLENGASFTLLERSPISVSGVLGEQIVYTHIVSPGGTYGPEKVTSFPWIEYEAYFEKNGVLWHIIVTSNPSKADTTKEEFEHIISTFKFLS